MTEKDFHKTLLGFHSGVQALFAMVKQTGQVADDQDLSDLTKFFKGLAKFDVEFDYRQFVERITTLGAQVNDATKLSDFLKETDIDVSGIFKIKEDNTILPEKGFTDFLSAWTRENPEEVKQFMYLLSGAKRHPIARGEYLRRGALISLIGVFDACLSKLMPEDEEQNYKRYQSQNGQLILFSSKMAGNVYCLSKRLSLTEDEKKWFAGHERLILKRNLYAHNNGGVDRAYLDKLERIRDEDPAVYPDVGKSYLWMPMDELLRAFDIFHLLGIMLIQKMWRLDDASTIKQADEDYAPLMLDLIYDERYAVVDKLGSLARDLRIESQTGFFTKQVITVNHAIVLKEMGELERMRRVLSRLKNPGEKNFSNRFEMARYALLGGQNIERALIYLKYAIESGEILYPDIQEPIFDYLRGQPGFDELIRSSFKADSLQHKLP